MVNKLKYAWNAVLGFSVLAVIYGMVTVGIGTLMLSRVNNNDELLIKGMEKQIMLENNRPFDLSPKERDDLKEKAKSDLHFIATFHMVIGVISIIDGIIGIPGVIRKNRLLVITHMVISVLSFIGMVHLILNGFSFQIFFIFTGIFVILSVGATLTLMELIKRSLVEQSQALASTPGSSAKEDPVELNTSVS